MIGRRIISNPVKEGFLNPSFEENGGSLDYWEKSSNVELSNDYAAEGYYSCKMPYVSESTIKQKINFTGINSIYFDVLFYQTPYHQGHILYRIDEEELWIPKVYDGTIGTFKEHVIDVSRFKGEHVFEILGGERHYDNFRTSEERTSAMQGFVNNDFSAWTDPYTQWPMKQCWGWISTGLVQRVERMMLPSQLLSDLGIENDFEIEIIIPPDPPVPVPTVLLNCYGGKISQFIDMTQYNYIAVDYGIYSGTTKSLYACIDGVEVARFTANEATVVQSTINTSSLSGRHSFSLETKDDGISNTNIFISNVQIF